MATKKLREIVAKQVSMAIGLTEEQILPLINFPQLMLKKRCGGELSVSVKSLNDIQNPGQVLSDSELIKYAGKVAAKITHPGKYIENIAIDSTHISFKIKPSRFVEYVLGKINSAGQQYGVPRSNEPKKKVIIEYSSPNIAKPFHAGHLRSTVIGQFLTNLHKLLGHQVTSINYLGDWGTQFGILAAGLKKQNQTVFSTRSLFDVYVAANSEAEVNAEFKIKAREIFRKMEDGDEEILSLWREIRDQSVSDYSHTYKHLGIKFDEYSGESKICTAQKITNSYLSFNNRNGTDIIDLSPDGSMSKFVTLARSDGTSLYITRDLAAAIERFKRYEFDNMYYVVDKSQAAQDLTNQLKETNILQKAINGTDIIDLSPDGSMSKFVTLARSDGTSLYITRDLAAAIERFKRYEFDNMYYVVDKSQADHFSGLFQTLSKIGHDWSDRCHHVSFGRVLGMSTRKGNVVFLEDIIEEAKLHMLQNMRASKTTKKFESEVDEEHVAETLGVSAIIVQDLKSKLMSDYRFEWDRALQAKGDTGVFLQYTHARLSSICRKSGVSLNLDADTNLLLEEEAIQLVHHLALFEGAIQTAYTENEASRIVNYLFKLCRLISIANKVLQVKGTPTDLAEARLLLFNHSQDILSTGMKVLGLKPLNKM
ncbi:probable arginine--tRNA ligase, mitochondrial [Antedon mediterranea]|uniref:probable arginine--tRNA ligase, mitochondrial n=1 Tax=Antedon mediterranea TaxID=105859 RepID=UPI003AF646E0